MQRLIGLVMLLLIMSAANQSLLRAAENTIPLDEHSGQPVTANSPTPEPHPASLDWSQGILAIVRPDDPETPIYFWDAGIIECSEPAHSETFCLKNVGSERINLSSAPIVPEINGFWRSTTCRCTNVLNPGQMDTCRFTVWFEPTTNGPSFDTMRVQTDAWNGYGGFVRFPLSGQRVSTPVSPHVVISIHGSDVSLLWNVVSHSRLGCGLGGVEYSIYSASSLDGNYHLLGTTTDTSFTQTAADPAVMHLNFRVTARVP